MSYGGFPYGGVTYAGGNVALIPTTNTQTTLAVEVAFSTDPLAEPAWVDITPDVRSWSTSRGRRRELERHQPGRATIILDNRSRQYDSLYSAGPWFGNLRPMKRMRIRETFNGVTYPVFDGFADKWTLDYPNVGRDATATLTATDGFKVAARADLGRSVYAIEVKADNPALWWHLDETVEKFFAGFALNSGDGGSTRNGTFVDKPNVHQDNIVALDPGASMRTVTVTDLGAPTPRVPPKTGVFLANAALDILANTTFSIECWQRLEFGGVSNANPWTISIGASNDLHGSCDYFDSAGDLTTGQYRFLVQASGGNLYGVLTPSGSVLQGSTHHVVCVVETGGQMAIYLDGTRYTTQIGGTSGTNLTGITRKTGGALSVAYHPHAAETGARNWHGLTQEFAVYLTDLSQARVTAHYNAGSAPWSGDLPGARIGRVLDRIAWPATLRELDVGQTTFQSAAITQTALEHIQKAAESEYVSLLFMSRDGKVRFIDRSHVMAREPYSVAFSDTAGEIGYHRFVPDDGDDEIRNRATISRLNGVAKTVDDTASITRFGIFEYGLDGLLHDSDTVSQDYASFVTDQYGDQRRRVTSLSVGPPVTGTEAVVYPAMLGLELGDAITVQNTPLAVGSEFSQVCVVEGIAHSGAPGGVRETVFALSPELPIRTLEDVDVATLGYAQVTASQTGIGSTTTDLTGLTTTVTVGASRRVRVSVGVIEWTRTAGTVTFALQGINEGAAVLTLLTVGINNTYNGGFASVVLTPSAGSHTYKATGRCDVGGTVTMSATATAPAYILVEDIGPA